MTCKLFIYDNKNDLKNVIEKDTATAFYNIIYGEHLQNKKTKYEIDTVHDEMTITQYINTFNGFKYIYRFYEVGLC